METDRANVSVIIAAYQAEQVIERAIQSALAQTVPPLQIIVVDDASSDRTAQNVRSIARSNPSVELLTLEVNGGPAKARNTGIDAAKGEWVAILDADDAWEPDRLEILLRDARDLGADFIADNQILFDAVANVKTRVGFEAVWTSKQLSIADYFENDIVKGASLNYGLLKPFIRSDFLRRTGLRYDETVRYGEDFLLTSEILFSGGSAYLLSYAGYIYTTRVGERSGRSSPFSKSIPQFDSLIRASDFIEEKYASSITPSMRNSIRTRRRYLSNVHMANSARALRQARKYNDYLFYVLSRPRLAGFLAQSVLRKLNARLPFGSRAA